MNQHRNLSFYIESLLLLLFLLAALVVLIRVFGAAQSLGLQARQKTDAALILQSASAEFSAREEPFGKAIEEAVTAGESQAEYRCDSQGHVQADGSYRVVVTLQSQQREMGTMVFADLCVTPASDATATPLGELETSLYCPQSGGEEVQP